MTLKIPKEEARLLKILENNLSNQIIELNSYPYFFITATYTTRNKTPLELIFDKNYLINQIEKLEGRNVNDKYYNFTIINENNKINIYFNNKNYNLIGWQTEDIYQNLAITFISKIKTNQKINNKIFEIPKMRMN